MLAIQRPFRIWQVQVRLYGSILGPLPAYGEDSGPEDPKPEGECTAMTRQRIYSRGRNAQTAGRINCQDSARDFYAIIFSSSPISLFVLLRFLLVLLRSSSGAAGWPWQEARR
jgi:hypothetical protein